MAIVAVIMSVNFAACSDDDDEGTNGSNPLVGTWIDDGTFEVVAWKFNTDGTGVEQFFEGGQPDDTYLFTYTYDAKTTVLTITYKDDVSLIPEVDTYYVTFNGNIMTTRQFFDDEIGDDSYVATWTKQ